ncbi:hypothetical protein K438DRAFT_1968699 [Mycena galopus ATCC 62051]|nr:hypothetical protein K438DRAFT_1968699 [Mycena galopus ATCC 62051]
MSTAIDIILITGVNVMSWKEIANTGSLLFTADPPPHRRRHPDGLCHEHSRSSDADIGPCHQKSSTVPAALSYLIGPMYVLTLLYNLNLRPYDDVGASDTGTDDSLTHPSLTHPSLTRPPLTHPSFTNPACTVDTCMDSIHVHRTPTVSIEPLSGSAHSGANTSRSFVGTKFEEDSNIGPC